MFNYFLKVATVNNVNVVIYDYVGYGLSSKNTPTESLCYESLEVVVKYLTNVLNINMSNIYLVGQQLGTAVVIDYAWKNYWKNPIMLISSFKNVSDKFDSMDQN